MTVFLGRLILTFFALAAVVVPSGFWSWHWYTRWVETSDQMYIGFTASSAAFAALGMAIIAILWAAKIN